MHHQADPVGIAFDSIQNQDVWVRKEGLRMARGKCHRSQSLKQLGLILFWPRACIKTGEPSSEYEITS